MIFPKISQQDGRLCAQHCLNAALQGPYFSAVDLGELASRLDEDERQRMAECGVDSAEYRRFVNQPSENMDDTGYFSVQVISRALSLWSLELTPRNSSDALAQRCRLDPSQAAAFIFHMDNHWFCIRRFAGDVWFNLNSLLDAPTFMSNIYIAEYLQQMEQEGYMVFIVSGKLPECLADRKPPKTRSTPSSSSTTSTSNVKPWAETAGRRLNSDTSSANKADTQGGDPDLDAAIKLSMEAFEPAAPNADDLRQRRLAFFAAKPPDDRK